MFPKKLNIQIVAILTTLVIGITLITHQIQANNVCGSNAESEIENQIDIYSTLESAPTLQERGQKNKKTFVDKKQKSLDSKYTKIKESAIQEAKNTFSITKNVDVIEDYSFEITKEKVTKNGVELETIVTINRDYKDGAIDNNNFQYNLILDNSNNIVKIKHISDIIPQQLLPEDKEFLDKLEKQNSSNGKIVKDNPLGMSDDEWSKTKDQKQKNLEFKNKLSPKDAHQELRKDHRPEFKAKKQQLIQEKKDISCNTIKASAGS